MKLEGWLPKTSNVLISNEAVFGGDGTLILGCVREVDGTPWSDFARCMKYDSGVLTALMLFLFAGDDCIFWPYLPRSTDFLNGVVAGVIGR